MQIVDRWEAGVLQKLGLVQSEVEQLVGALFEDTPLRREALRRLRGQGAVGGRASA